MEEEVPVRQAKRGAPVHRIWSDAFDEPDVYSTRIPNNAICKHCKQSVRHHHKTLSVETHVRKCRPIQEDHVGHGRGWPPRLVDGSHRERSQEVDGGRLHKFQEQLVRRRQVTAIGSMPLSRRSSTMRWPYITIAQAQASSESKIPISFGLFNWHGRVRDCRHLLEECYQQVKVEVDKVLSAESQFVCITSDAWSNMSNEPVVNYMAVCLTKSLFLEAVHTEEQAHDADWLSSDLSRVIDSLGDTVVGAITDNTATNRKVWNELKPKYSKLF